MRRRKVLIVTPFPIEPEIEGNRRRIKVLANQLVELGAEVHIALLPLKRPRADDLNLMRARWGKSLYVMPPKYPTAPVARATNKLQRLAFAAYDRFRSRHGSTLTGVDVYYYRWWTIRLAFLQKMKRFDIVVAEYIFMSRAFAAFGPAVMKVIDTHDVFANRNSKMSASGLSYKWWSVTEPEEADAIRRADITFAIEAGEADQFRQYTDRPVYCVPHVPERDTSPDHASNNRLLIVGSGNPINLQGVRWFVTEVFPQLLTRQPGVTLYVVGDVCDVLREEVAGDAAIQLLGRVDSLDSHYAAADVVINPVQVGTGLGIKSIEALAHGRPLVSTVSGARGIGVEAGIFVARTPVAMADHIVTLLRSPFSRQAAAEAGLSYLQKLRAENRALLQSLLDGPGLS